MGSVLSGDSRMSVDRMEAHLGPCRQGVGLSGDSRLMATTLDARSMEGAEVEDNLTVRGLVFRLGEGAYGCFDTNF